MASALIGGRKIALTLCAIGLNFQLSNKQGLHRITQPNWGLSDKHGWTERNLALNDQRRNIANLGGIQLGRASPQRAQF